MDMELEAPHPWVTVEEAEAPAGVSLAACDTCTEHPWQQDDVEPCSPSPAPSFPQHATGGARTNITAAPAANKKDQRPEHPSSAFHHLLYPTGPSQSAGFSTEAAPSQHDRPPPHRSSLPSLVVSSGLPCASPPDRGEAITTSTTSSSSSNRRRTTRDACVELLVSARRTMDYLNEGAGFARSTYHAVRDTAAGVWRALTSKTAERTVLTTMLVSLVSTLLFGLACLAYLAFYYEYLPDQVTTAPVHLQFG